MLYLYNPMPTWITCHFKEYTLDFKQSVAFEIMASSFILKSLNIEGISIEDIHMFVEDNDINRLNIQTVYQDLKHYER